MNKPNTIMHRWFGRFQVWPHAEGVLCRDFLLPTSKSLPPSRYAHLHGLEREQAFFQHGLLPSSLSTFEQIIPAHNSADMLFWQFPCRTEADAWDRHAALPGAHREGDILHIYLGLPWATWIDCERKQAWGVSGLISKARQLQAARIRIAGWHRALAEVGMRLKVHTVCQHIYWRDLCETWQQTGVSDVWLSHLPQDAAQQPALHPNKLGFTPHPWALYAVNVEDIQRNCGIEIGKDLQQKSVLASFVGAYSSNYLSPSRQLLQALASEADCVIKINGKWHFEDVVYRHQMAGVELSQSYAIDDSVTSYNRLLSDSVFSLCPAGTGPNSLRLWESLAVGSIPVLLGPEPMLPSGGNLTALNWDEIVLRCSDADIPQLAQRLRRIPIAERQARQERAIAAYAQVRQQRCF